MRRTPYLEPHRKARDEVRVVVAKLGLLSATRWCCLRTQSPLPFIQAGEAGLLKRTIASNATYSVPGNASEGVRSAWPVRRQDSSTVGDTSPGDAFPALSSLVRGSKPASPARIRTRPCAKCEAESLPHRRVGSRKQ